MGWASGGEIFDDIAQALVDLKAPDELKTELLGRLIDKLQENDWDTEDESLNRFQNDPAIVEAFRQRDVILGCGEQSDRGSWCEHERGHELPHRDDEGEQWGDDDKEPSPQPTDLIGSDH